MKNKHFIRPMLWAASACLIAGPMLAFGQTTQEKKPPRADAQAILDQLNSERTTMTGPDGEIDPQEAEHVQRMIRLYELRSGFVDLDEARQQAGLPPRQTEAELAREQSDQQAGEVQQLRTEVADLRQQLQDLRGSTPQSSQENNSAIQDAAGSQRPERHYRSFDRPRRP